MHELAVAESLADLVETRAAEHAAVRVGCIVVCVGEASGIVPDSLNFCFEVLASERPLLAGARLEIELVPHRAWCPHCAADFAVERYIVRCPTCGEWSGEILSGTELQVREMEYEVAAAGETDSADGGETPGVAAAGERERETG